MGPGTEHVLTEYQTDELNNTAVQFSAELTQLQLEEVHIELVNDDDDHDDGDDYGYDEYIIKRST